MDFQSCFSSEEGMQLLLRKFKVDSKNLQVFIEILEKEFEILEFSKEKLKKIAQKTREMNLTEEFRTMRHVMVKMEDIYLQKSKNIEQSLDSLKTQVLEPLQNISIYQSQARKVHKQNLEKALKGKQQTELAFYKSKDKYFLKQKELMGLKGDYVILNAKDALKRDQRMDKLAREVEVLDAEYQHNG
jgi:hypothetical protein